MLYKYLIYTISNDIYKITVKCYQNFQFSKVIRCLPVKTDGYRSVNIDYRSVNNGYRFFEFELSFRAVSSGFRRFTAGLPIPLVGENRFTVGKVNPGVGSMFTCQNENRPLNSVRRENNKIIVNNAGPI